MLENEGSFTDRGSVEAKLARLEETMMLAKAGRNWSRFRWAQRQWQQTMRHDDYYGDLIAA